MPTRAPSTPAVTKIDVRGSPKRSVGLRTRRRAPVVGASPERESSRSPDTPSVASEAPVTFPRTEKLGRTQRERSSWTEDQTVYRNQKRETDGSNMTCLKSLIGGKHPLVSQVAVGAGAFEPGRRSDERLSCRVEPHCLPSSATRTLQMPHVLPPQKSMSYRSRIRVPPTTLQNPWKNMFFQPARGNRSNILGAPRPLSEKVTWCFTRSEGSSATPRSSSTRLSGFGPFGFHLNPPELHRASGPPELHRATACRCRPGPPRRRSGRGSCRRGQIARPELGEVEPAAVSGGGPLMIQHVI